MESGGWKGAPQTGPAQLTGRLGLARAAGLCVQVPQDVCAVMVSLLLGQVQWPQSILQQGALLWTLRPVSLLLPPFPEPPNTSICFP